MKAFLIISISIILLILIALISLFLWLRNGVKALSKDYPSNERIKGNSLKKALVLYQPSLHQTAETFANTVMDTFLNLGYKVTVNNIDQGSMYNVSQYDIIAFGSPVYVGNVSPKFEKYVKNQDIKWKKVILYSIGTIQKENHELDNLENILKQQNIVYKIKVQPNPSGEQELISFIKSSI